MRFAAVALLVLFGGNVVRAQTYESENMPSQTGGFFYNDRTGGDFVRAGREALRGINQPGFIVFGPYAQFATPQRGFYWAQFKFRKSGNGTSRSPFVTFEVYDATARRMLATQTLKVGDVYGGFTFVNLYFGRPNPAHRIEFRAYWHGNASLRIDRVKVDILNLRP